MANITPLTDLMVGLGEPSKIIAYGNSGAITIDSFACDVASWFDVFSQSQVQAWGVFTYDSYQFATILVALWYAKKEVVLLGDNVPQSIRSVSDYVGGLVGDFSHDNIGKSAFSGKYLQPANVPETNYAFTTSEILDAQSVALSVFTSGSTGKPKQIAIKFSQLINEIESHEALWGSELANAPVAATVSHQHLYGLIFKVLWPVSAARPFVNKNISVLEELAQLAQQFSTLSVVTTPSHLGRLPDTIDWNALKGRWAKIFSSAAPLGMEDSHAAKRKFYLDITEVYGSSETGGIAWRQQTSFTGTLWCCFDAIEIAQDLETDVLKILSPFLPALDWYTCADKVEIVSAKSFKLLGRVDRIAKIEGKRVSLSAIEQTLESTQWVAHARVVIKQENRVLTCVVIKLTEVGCHTLEVRGRKKLTTALKNILLHSFEPVVVPRKWRYVSEFPCDMQGKISQQSLLQLFECEV